MIGRLLGALAAILLASACTTTRTTERPDTPVPPAAPTRIVTADVVAINQPIVYNRFGSMNPWGMVYALRGDLADAQASAGNARLKPDRRPRPLVLRVSEGDELRIRFQNLLAPAQRLDGRCMGTDTPQPARAPENEAEEDEVESGGADTTRFTVPDPPNDPCTRRAGVAIVGLTPLDGGNPVATGLNSPAPGEAAVTYRYRADKAGSYFFSSLAAIAGGEGDGGSLTHGLFGMVVVEPRSSRYYRSQVAKADLDCARDPATGGPGCASTPGAAWLDYEATRDGKPLLNMLRKVADGSYEIVHGDLTAIVVGDDAGGVGQPATDQPRAGTTAWREFAIMFHDELKTVHHPDFAVLNGPTGPSPAEKARHQQMVGTRDGFGINYGASGMGTVLLANRVGKGPSRNCVDCAYEEFFLGSWANGDPALLGQYADDPSNVYHSYLGDRVKFYNVHAGPKETHVFHLHAHQWLSQATQRPEGGGPPTSKGNYLDSQSIAPFQTFGYEIYYGGTGNRNLTPGDSIFHCHLYPHFAQGMWSLWRVHEVLEDGARKLPDVGGAWGFKDGEGWHYDAAAYAGPGTDKATGAHGAGTPIPALVPLPGQALPPEPTYGNSPPVQLADGTTAPVMPGYPFYIAGKAGYRAPQPPRDLVEDAGLPRHLTEKPDGCTGGINGCARTMPTLTAALDAGDMTFPIKKVKLSILPDAGDNFERAAMNWHAGRAAGLDPYDASLPTNWFHQSRLVESNAAAPFLVNGLEAAPGAPFANPCPLKPGSADHWARGLPSLATRERRYDVSAIELQLVVNQYGWHDKQARINVLNSDVAAYEDQRRAADPFFFRANSGECIVFTHTNRTPGHTLKDAFQVATPTDVIGQHIHLVKFDVTSSDGSANGYNYEDGTLAYDHIEHMIAASKAPGGSAVDSVTGTPMTLTVKTAGGKPVYQGTIQRWWADPLLDGEGQDRTIATVFTHDHFGPSSIQQHGFYSALLIEPAGEGWDSTWKKPDGSPLTSGVGTQAIIEVPANATDVSPNLRGARREFALAVADFALLYDRNDKPIAPPHGDPTRPEAISVDHHDPYLFNYKNEPIPLRVGSTSGSGGWRQRTDKYGDMGNLFDSTIHGDSPLRGSLMSTIDLRRNHAPGDPSTEIFEAYDGDKVQVRMVQGAQEVQHNFTLHGQKWRRHSADPLSPWVSSQEIGISEHFEMDMQLQRATTGDPARLTSDFLYHAGSVDSLWNGAWGLFRSYAEPSLTRDVAPGREGLPIRCRLAVLGAPSAASADPECGGAIPATAVANAPIVGGFEGLGSGNAFRVPGAWGRLFCIEAVAGPLTYNAAGQAISDPNALRFRLAAAYRVPPDRMNNPPTCPRAGSTLPLDLEAIPLPADDNRPLVLRVKSGEMAIVNVANRLPEQLPRTQDNAMLPPIVSAAANSTLNDSLTPSSRVGLHPGLVSYAVRHNDGARVGLNGNANVSVAGPGGTTTAYWYAGTVEFATGGGSVPVTFKPFETTTGMVTTLSSMADPIRHPTAGLVGALVIEPADADLDGAYGNGQVRDGGISARICRTGRPQDCWDEFIVVYQDGLNLKQADSSGSAQSIPDCHVCDDSYDSGDVAVNFRTEPFWARLGLPREDPDPDPEADGKKVLVDLNKYEIPDGMLLPGFGGREAPTFCTLPGRRVIVHAVHPGGRARQRAFVTYGLQYDDLNMPRFGSPHASLLGPQKAATMDLGRVADGLWLYRDGPAYITAGGSWGYIDARAAKPDGACAPTP